MKEYAIYFVATLVALALLAFAGIGLALKTKSSKPQRVVCKECGGTGEKEEDINLLMAKAAYSIWLNGHSYGCEACNKSPDGGSCDVSRKKYKEIMDKYEEKGPDMGMAVCPGCMGAGTYTQHDGYRTGREKD